MLGRLAVAAALGVLLAGSATAVESPAPFRFERSAAPGVAVAPRREPASDPALDDLADCASPELLSELARYRPSCLSWRPAALRVECRLPRVRRDISAQSLFLATRFLIAMYASRGYLVYGPRAPAVIRGGTTSAAPPCPCGPFRPPCAPPSASRRSAPSIRRGVVEP